METTVTFLEKTIIEATNTVKKVLQLSIVKGKKTGCRESDEVFRDEFWKATKILKETFIVHAYPTLEIGWIVR